MKKIKSIGEKIRAKAGKIMIGLVLASLVGGLSALPAFARDFRRDPPPDRDRYERRDRYRDDYYRRRVYRDYAPRHRVYAPPPIIVEPPPPPPGIHIFFPPIIIR